MCKQEEDQEWLSAMNSFLWGLDLQWCAQFRIQGTNFLCIFRWMIERKQQARYQQSVWSVCCKQFLRYCIDTSLIHICQQLEKVLSCCEVHDWSLKFTIIPTTLLFFKFRFACRCHKLTMLRAGQAYRTSHQPMMEEEKGIILGFMEQNPKVTAKESAKEMGVNLSLVHRRIRGLKKEGKIRYSPPNGRGKWEALQQWGDRPSC